MRSALAKHDARRAYTLIEILVAVSIVGLLAALTIAGVQAARESVRRAQCANNLRQIGFAMHSYLSHSNVFPSAMMGGDHTGLAQGKPGRYFPYSSFSRILPELGQQTVAGAIDFGSPPGSPANATAASIVLEVLLCPSDAAPSKRRMGPANYRVNMGSGVRVLASEMAAGEAGPFEALKWCSPADLTDGLSVTALVSEKSRGDGNAARWDGRRDFWYADFVNNPPYPTSAVVERCSAVPSGIPPHNSDGGSNWLFDDYANTYYNHSVGPNSAVPDCSTFPPPVPGTQAWGGSGVFAARSWHGTGVNVLTADGAGHWVSSSVAIPVWRALGTRAGGETVGTPF
jgi:prepilin-type N-terminal cleavage/methylation domain-containing protein